MQTRYYSVHIKDWLPIGSENVKANSTTCVDVRMIDLSIAVAFWWCHWVRFWNFNCKFVFTSFPLAINIFQVEKNFELHLCSCIWETDNAMQIIFNFLRIYFWKIFLNSKLGSCHSRSSRASCCYCLFLSACIILWSSKHF